MTGYGGGTYGTSFVMITQAMNLSLCGLADFPIQESIPGTLENE